jgi:glyoxylase-like metal-dependent hydrolase (beta-lactamase superfamily II)
MILKELKITTHLKDRTNCYIIHDEQTKETMVIDPAGEVDKIVEMLDILQAKVKYILITHCHGDHIGGVNELRERKGGTILIHRICSQNLNNQEIMLTEYIGMEPIILNDVRIVDDGDLLHIGDIEFRVIHTPGHTNGGISLYCEKYKMLFSGDTLFRGTWGRVDLPTGGFKEILDSIINKLLILPEDTMVYPGHGAPTMIGDEKPIYLQLKPRRM